MGKDKFRSRNSGHLFQFGENIMRLVIMLPQFPFQEGGVIEADDKFCIEQKAQK